MKTNEEPWRVYLRVALAFRGLTWGVRDDARIDWLRSRDLIDASGQRRLIDRPLIIVGPGAYRVYARPR